MTDLPTLEQFKPALASNGVVHLVFDMPGRSMNVLSNAAIRDLELVAQWLPNAPITGVVISSGKSTAFCAGADLGELGAAYDMITAAPGPQRGQIAFDHFFRLSAAVRAIEIAGKPIACAIGGLALGGGCELALGAHYRVLADTPRAAMGLPESLVGLFPGCGGTQRLPRLIGAEASLPILLDGARLAGKQALSAGLIDDLVVPGEEIGAAERWVLSSPSATPKWDRPDWQPIDIAVLEPIIDQQRARVLKETLGHEPALLAILDCVEQGLPLGIDSAIRVEMELFATLIQRREPKNMIRVLFQGRLDYERALKGAGIPANVTELVNLVTGRFHALGPDLSSALTAAGFRLPDASPAEPDAARAADYWFDSPPMTPAKQLARDKLTELAHFVGEHRDTLSPVERRIADYILVTQAGYPAYLGGPFGS